MDMWEVAGDGNHDHGATDWRGGAVYLGRGACVNGQQHQTPRRGR